MPRTRTLATEYMRSFQERNPDWKPLNLLPSQQPSREPVVIHRKTAPVLTGRDPNRMTIEELRDLAAMMDSSCSMDSPDSPPVKHEESSVQNEESSYQMSDSESPSPDCSMDSQYPPSVKHEEDRPVKREEDPPIKQEVIRGGFIKIEHIQDDIDSGSEDRDAEHPFWKEAEISQSEMFAYLAVKRKKLIWKKKRMTKVKKEE